MVFGVRVKQQFNVKKMVRVTNFNKFRTKSYAIQAQTITITATTPTTTTKSTITTITAPTTTTTTTTTTTIATTTTTTSHIEPYVIQAEYNNLQNINQLNETIKILHSITCFSKKDVTIKALQQVINDCANVTIPPMELPMVIDVPSLDVMDHYRGKTAKIK